MLKVDKLFQDFQTSVQSPHAFIHEHPYKYIYLKAYVVYT